MVVLKFDTSLNIETVATAAADTSSGAEGTREAARELTGMAADLGKLVSQFNYESGALAH